MLTGIIRVTDDLNSIDASNVNTELILDLKFDVSNGYAILIDNDLAGIIEVVDNMNSTDLEAIRNKYIPE